MCACYKISPRSSSSVNPVRSGDDNGMDGDGRETGDKMEYAMATTNDEWPMANGRMDKWQMRSATRARGEKTRLVVLVVVKSQASPSSG